MTNQADKPSVEGLSELVFAYGRAEVSCRGIGSDEGAAAYKAVIKYAERLASQSAAAPPIAPVAWRFKDMAGNVHYAESVTPLAQSDITPLYAAPPSAVLLEVLEAMELLAELHDAMGAPQGPARTKVAAAIAKLREWMGEKG